jgi:hypothetical protein
LGELRTIANPSHTRETAIWKHERKTFEETFTLLGEIVMATSDLTWEMDTSTVKADAKDVAVRVLYASAVATATLVVSCDASKVDNADTAYPDLAVTLYNAAGKETNRILLAYKQPLTVTAHQVRVVTSHAKALFKGSYNVL